MGPAFEPVGDRARWRVLYELLVPLQVGGVLTYDEMATALGLDPRTDRRTVQLAMRRAAQELLEVHKRAVDVIPNEGYRIVEPEQHLSLARRHQRKAGNALVRGQSKVVNVDYNRIDPETRKAFEIVAGVFAAQIDFNRRMDVRQDKLEAALAAVTRKTEAQAERTDEEIAELRARLKWLEEQSSGSE
jgi:phage shock protein A